MKLFTPSGFKLVSDIEVGDSVVCEDSSLAIVTSKIQKPVKTYDVSMQDGTEFRLSENTNISYYMSRSGHKSKVRSTDQLYTSFTHGTTKDSNESVYKPITPLTNPVDFGSNKELLIDPYVLGVVLGDGCITQSTCKVTSADYQIIRNMEDLGYECRKQKNKVDEPAQDYCIIGLATVLRKYGLIGRNSYSKFIPEDYLTASVEDRFSLVQGLMDTDGYADIGGRTDFCTVSPALRDGIRFILQSLGFTVTVGEKLPFYRDKNGQKVVGQLAYVLYIRGRNQKKLFRLDRKIDRVKSKPVGNRVNTMSLSEYDTSYILNIDSEKAVLTTGFVPIYLKQQKET